MEILAVLKARQKEENIQNWRGHNLKLGVHVHLMVLMTSSTLRDSYCKTCNCFYVHIKSLTETKTKTSNLTKARATTFWTKTLAIK